MEAANETAEAVQELKEGQSSRWRRAPMKAAIVGGALLGGVGTVMGSVIFGVAGAVGGSALGYSTARVGQKMAKKGLNKIEPQEAQVRPKEPDSN